MFNWDAVYYKGYNWLLNKNPDLVSICRHKNGLLLKGLKRNSRRNDTVVSYIQWSNAHPNLFAFNFQI